MLAERERMVFASALCCYAESATAAPPTKDGQYTHRKRVPIKEKISGMLPNSGRDDGFPSTKATANPKYAPNI